MTAPADLAQQGMDAATYAADSRIVAIVDSIIALENASGREWSANTIRHQLPACNPGLIGARVRAASMRRPVEMRRVGWVASTLPSTHGKPIGVYVGVPQ